MPFLQHVWQSRPSLINIALASAIWGLTIPICVIVDYLIWQRMLPPGIFQFSALFTIGAAIAAPMAIWIIRIFTFESPTSCFAAVFLLLSSGTIGMTALLFAFDFWLYFTQWHAPLFSKFWLVQLVFTFGSAVYQFLVSGVRMYLPFGLIALLIASFWATKRIMR